MQSYFDEQIQLSLIGCDNLIGAGPGIVQSIFDGNVSGRQARLDFIKKALFSSKVLRREYMILREKVEGLLLRSTPRNSKMWAQFGKGLPPITQLDALKWDPNPGVRRGISKLLFLSELSADSNEFDSLVSGKQISNKKTKDVLKGLGWVSTSLRGNSVYDADVTDAINSGALAVLVK